MLKRSITSDLGKAARLASRHALTCARNATFNARAIGTPFSEPVVFDVVYGAVFDSIFADGMRVIEREDEFRRMAAGASNV
jgi:hypothetical protein